jgi:hypothetical protein
MTSTHAVTRCVFIIAGFVGVAAGQTLSSFTCGPTSVVVGASFTCVASLTAAAPLTGVAVGFSTSGAGLSVPASVKVSWGRTSVSFAVGTASSTPPQTSNILATAGAVSKSASVTISSASSASYSVSSLSCTPAKIIPDQTATCVAYLSAQAPPGGLTASLKSSSPDLKIPSSVAISSNGFTFQATASDTVSVLESVTLSASVQGSSKSTVETIDPTPKFYFRGNTEEIGNLKNGAAVPPSVCPAGWLGSLTVRGAGYLAFVPATGGDGVAFHQSSAQNTDVAFVNFGGSGFEQVFDTASEISFLLKSSYSFAERSALPYLNMRTAFEVMDASTSRFIFATYTTGGQLQFVFGAQGFSALYAIPSGQADQIFGKGVVAKISIKWINTSFSLYVNDTLVRTVAVSPTVANWSALSTLTIGSRSVRIAGGGLYASDDSIADLMIR